VTEDEIDEAVAAVRRSVVRAAGVK
jgi:hypothetical protein